MKFRQFTTNLGVRVLTGKDAKSNEDLIKQVEDGEIVLHTAKPGSPFINIKHEKPGKRDLKEAAVFCASRSQDWRDNKSDVEVHQFYGRDIYKEKKMKLGTFGVKRFKIIKVKKKDIENLMKK